jgi:hypothetical protein
LCEVIELGHATRSAENVRVLVFDALLSSHNLVNASNPRQRVFACHEVLLRIQHQAAGPPDRQAAAYHVRGARRREADHEPVFEDRHSAQGSGSKPGACQRLDLETKDRMGSVKAMLYATDGIKSDEDFNKAMVGVASVWYVVLSF